MDKLTHILIADDDVTVLESTADLLRLEGYQCTAVPDATAAAALLRQSKYDLLIADIHMAGNLHLELVEELAKKGVGIPIILMTGYPEVQTAIQALNLPVVAYLVKPFELDHLLAEVKAGVQLSGLYNTVSDAKIRADNSYKSLQDISEALISMPKGMLSAPLTNFFTLTMHNIVNGLFDWERLTESLLVSKESQTVLQLSKGTLLKVQRDLLEDAIKTLEKTKGAFKSKELGELRKRLEEFLKFN